MRNSCIFQRGSLGKCCRAWYKSSGQASEVKLALNTFYCRWHLWSIKKKELGFYSPAWDSGCTHPQLLDRLGSSVQGVSPLPWQTVLRGSPVVLPQPSEEKGSRALLSVFVITCKGSALTRDVVHALEGPGTQALECCWLPDLQRAMLTSIKQQKASPFQFLLKASDFLFV